MNNKLFNRIRRRIWAITVSNFRNRKVYFKLYKSYWRSRFIGVKNQSNNNSNYFSTIPNPGAGIGHQISNWIAGFWFAQKFGLKFAHIPFSSEKWENFLGFGEGSKTVNELLEKEGYKKVRIPLFKEESEDEVSKIRRILASYGNKKVIFICEQDQYLRDQFVVSDEIKKKFYESKFRKFDRIIYDKKSFNIAIHVRRGDIGTNNKNDNPNLQMRWQNNSYFVKVLSEVVAKIVLDKPFAIYLFSQGERKDFPEFEKFQNMYYCLDLNPQDSFLHMVYADLLITSKSSFSYKPALLSNGIKICPKDFWHGYPKKTDWILADSDGNF